VGALWRNPLEAWTQAHFEQPLVVTNLAIGEIAVVSEPQAVRRLLLENAANYRKDNLQRRMMSATLGDGLLMAEGDGWRTQRRLLAPLFAQKTVMGFAPAMLAAVDELTSRWRSHHREPVDVAADVTRVTLDVLERTIFSEGLGRDTEEVRAAMRTYFDGIGRIDPADLLGLPDFVPRLSRLKIRPALRLFHSAVDTIIETRRHHLAQHPESAPRDLLSLLLKALDPETGKGMSERELRANVITFIAAGHETTANAITWSLFLLSQSHEWLQRVRMEAERELSGRVEALSERLIETRAVVEEAIRLYPPLPAISRAAVNADMLAGHLVKPGSMVVVAPFVLHRHRALWSRPDVFDPARFIEPARNAIDRYAYLPFGAGPRVCIGAAFALQEAILVVAGLGRVDGLR
jgi:cytochrome P450